MVELLLLARANSKHMHFAKWSTWECVKLHMQRISAY